MEGIRTCLVFNAVIADPNFNEPGLAARLQIRIRQLRDAYETFPKRDTFRQASRKILKEVLPE